MGAILQALLGFLGRVAPFLLAYLKGRHEERIIQERDTAKKDLKDLDDAHKIRENTRNLTDEQLSFTFVFNDTNSPKRN